MSSSSSFSPFPILDVQHLLRLGQGPRLWQHSHIVSVSETKQQEIKLTPSRGLPPLNFGSEDLAFPWLSRGRHLLGQKMFGPFPWFFSWLFRGFFVAFILGKVCRRRVF